MNTRIHPQPFPTVALASKTPFAIFITILISFATICGAQPQTAYPGRGAISAQDIAKIKLGKMRMSGASAMKMSGMDMEGDMSGMDMTSHASADPADLVCARFAEGSVVSAPPELRSVNGVLEVTFKFQTATDAAGLVRYCYITPDGLQAPTLRVSPGDTLIIHFQNALPASASADNMAGMKMTLAADSTAKTASTDPACNGAMSADASNIHFHGLNVPPVCGQDEVVRTLVQPGHSFDYTVQIPANEPPGLYWYHPHPHGFSEGQVQGGATGALIVEGLQNVDTALAGLTERTFVVRDQLVPASEQDDPNIPAWDISINYVPVTYPAYTPAIVQANPGQQELWRVANTSADTILDLAYIVNGAAQPVQVVAIDGYPIASGSSGQLSATQTSILMPPGSRAEFVVTTPKAGDTAQLSTQFWNTGPDGDSDPTRTIATIVAAAGSENASSTRNAATKLPARVTPRKVKRFAAMAQATPVAQRTLAFSEVLSDPNDANSPTNFYITEAGQQPALFTMGQPPNIVVHSGTVEDWVIENHAEEDHIFHIHQIHFQVLEVNGVAVNDPAVRDTVDLPYWDGSSAYPSVKLRMDFRDANIVGTFVYHCHILQHEDAGMMGEIQVLPGGSATATTSTASATTVSPNGTLTLTANVADSATGAATPTGTVQFELNGATVGVPVALVNGVAALTTAVNGAAGTNNLIAFYLGDSNYTESSSPAIPITIPAFGLSSAGMTGTVGSPAIGTLTVNAANGYTTPIALGCTLPVALTEATCFIDPKSITGSGQLSLSVVTTPAHPLSASKPASSWFVSGGGTALASILLLLLPRRRKLGRIALPMLAGAILLAAAGCSSGVKTDPGTPQGSYTVVVTASAGTGAAQFQTSVSVPVTLH